MLLSVDKIYGNLAVRVAAMRTSDRTDLFGTMFEFYPARKSIDAGGAVFVNRGCKRDFGRIEWAAGYWFPTFNVNRRDIALPELNGAVALRRYTYAR